MTPAQIERVFGRGRLKMTTGEHVEVFREAVASGERRRYTKRFLATSDGDFGQWTEREWRILARLIGHGIRCVPDVVQFDGGAMGGVRLVQTYDAGVTVDQWATLLPVARDGAVRRHVFEDCAHWWALAHYCLTALDEIHSLQLVHLDIKGDNICVPYGPTNFDPDSIDRLYPVFPRLALIDFAFSLVSRENLSTPLPIGWQKDYDYQSPRLLKALDAGRNGDLQPTKELDWRCDLYSLAAMLKRYLPSEPPGDDAAWTRERYDDARTLIFRLRECHDRDVPHWRPHQHLMDFTGARIAQRDLAASLDHGWTLARDVTTEDPTAPITPLTRIAPSIRTVEPVRITTRIVVPTAVTAVQGAGVAGPNLFGRGGHQSDGARMNSRLPPAPRRTLWRATVLAPAVAAIVALAAPAFIGDPEHPLTDRAREAFDAMRSVIEGGPPDNAIAAPGTLPVPSGQPLDVSPGAVADSAPAQGEEPPPVAVSPEPPREQPDAKFSAMPGRSAPSTRIARLHAKSAMPANRAPPVSSLSQSASEMMMRPAHPLPRSASIANPKQPRGPSMASAGTSAHSSTWQSPVQKQRIQISPPEAPVVASTSAPTPPGANSIAQTASRAVDPARVAASDPAPDQSSSKPSVIAHQAQQADLPGTISDVRRMSTPAAAGASGGVERTPNANDQHRAPSQAANQGQQPTQNPQPFGEWRTLLSNLGQLLKGREGPPAPVEERRVLGAAPKLATSRPPVQSPPNVLAQASPQPATVASLVPGSTEQSRAEVHPSALPAPTTPLALIADARAEAAPSATSALPAPSLPPMVDAAPRASDQSQEVLVTRARRMISDVVPRVAAQAQTDVSRVLALAAMANHRSQQQAVFDAAAASWPGDSTGILPADIEPGRARRFHDEARQTFANGRLSDAVNAELTAFGANPHDPDIAVYLAYLHLRMNPVQPEAARQLALYAIAVSGSQRAIRFGDWNTLAVASALTGRDIEATRAFLVEVALTTNLDRTCQTARSAYATFGERLRVPVQAMFIRLDSNGRVSPYCEWPPIWSTASR